MRTGIKVNIAANLLARGWNALMSFIFVPVYLRFIGAEGYGFISLYTTLVALFALLDFGLALTANREIARYGARDDERSQARAMLRTFEAVYWMIAAVIGTAIALMADFVVHSWITLQNIPPEQAISGVQLMGLVAFVRWPVSLYVGVLQGMQRQVAANLITTISSTAAGAGAILILWLVAPRVDLFVGWQVLVFAVQIVALRIAAWRGLALAGDKPRARLSILRQSAGFSMGIMGITLLSLVLTQLDKLLLTRLLSLREFGYYSIASSIAGLIAMAGSAVQSATFPALTSAIERGDRVLESELYHSASRAVAVLILPAAITLAAFAPEISLVYLQDPEAADRISGFLTLLALGHTCLALVLIPYALQLASGWTSLSLYKNIVAIAIYLPSLLLVVPKFGAYGAAACWFGLTFSYLYFDVAIMHRRILVGEQWRWYKNVLGLPLIFSIGILGIARMAIPDDLLLWQKFGFILSAALLAQISCLMIIKEFRTGVLAKLRRIQG
ncbi:MAG: oligosaccharide flippase family protein [Novosphingobium sp.]|uniref:lipopolysaccharide biosynthesis protein n=1 Tax=Novosphingobium sp. TaxID=1874826 RepID=UPI0032BB7BB9